MGESLHVVGIRLPDAQWHKMKAVYDACMDADLGIPEKVLEFFGWQVPDLRGVGVELPLKEWFDDSTQIYEVAVKDIPAHVNFLRFYASPKKRVGDPSLQRGEENTLSRIGSIPN